MMGEFKKGDRVRALRSSGAGGFVAGDVYIVKRAYFQGAHHRISVEMDSVGSTTNGWIAENFELLPVAANAQPAPLTIQAGAYYRTRDGRKVGPAFEYGEYFDVDGWHYSASGKCGWCGQDNEEDYRRRHDIIAEWVDEPAAAVAGSNDNGGTAGFTIPVEDGWYATELGRAYADGYAAGLKAGSEESDSKLKVTIEADTSLLDDEIDRVLSRLKKLNKKALKSGVMLNFSELQDAT